MSTPRVYEAPVVFDQPTPAYKVVEVPGPFKKEVTKFNLATKELEKATVVMPYVYHVQFPRGHSLAYYSKEELAKYGYSEIVPLIGAGVNEAEVSKDAPAKSVHQAIVRAELHSTDEDED